ncbi:MAG: nickel-dependent hydrogenase large subunit [Eubacteriales bacterium]|nr:nickel-dependent hydrogenase large subunit [Eubacteriales bacterium]
MSYIIPVGPYHPALEEPVHARLIVDGERITDAEVFIGYNHRGIEKLCQERNFIQTITLVERVCGICSHSHAWTYCRCVEHIAGMEISKRAQYIRDVIEELERIHSHLLWLGVACHIVGHDSMFMQIWADREDTMDILELLTGNRVNYAMNIVGGVRRDITPEQSQQCLRCMDELEERMRRIADFLVNDKTIAMRTKGVGVLTTQDAIRIGAEGPHARASGVPMDVRRDAPYSSYEDFDFKVCVCDSGDVFARVVVRVEEIFESIRIIRQALANLPDGKLNAGNRIPRVPAGEFVARHEAPRGHLVYKVVTDGGPNNKRVSVHVPTFRNAPTIPTMLRGNSVADAGLIVASIDPCFSCMDC